MIQSLVIGHDKNFRNNVTGSDMMKNRQQNLTSWFRQRNKIIFSTIIRDYQIDITMKWIKKIGTWFKILKLN